MKGLSIEEKAKRYDEALGKARQLCAYPTSKPFISDLQDLFPELIVPEDERIREALVALVKCNERSGYTLLNNVSTSSMLAWLEKQGEPQVRTGIEWVNTIDDACDKRYSEEYAEGEYCHEQSFKWGFQEGVDWLEKQGNNADKVEPKFKIGDWIITPKNKVLQITNIEGTSYVFNNESHYWEIYYCDKQCRLWTIEDAKDGDALYSLDSCQPFIYKGRKSHEQATAYCGINKYDKFFVKNTEDCIIVLDKYVPATKEQRDTLERAMTNAGYRWNKEELKLEKI